MSDYSEIDRMYDGGVQGGGYSANENGSVFNSYEQASGYINPVGEQAAILEAASERDKEWEIGKSLYNGLVVQGGRGIIGTAKMANELWAEKAAANGYARNKDELMIGWNNVLNSSPLQRYQTGNNFANQLTEGAGQLVGQVAVAAIPYVGQVGSMAYMGAQIAGNQYLDLTAEGVDTQRAATASVANAVIQMPLERIGLGKILGGKANPLKRKFIDRLKDVSEAFLTEGLTEGLQEIPEQLTDIWAKNPGITMQGVGAEWDKNAEQNLKAMGLSGLIGGILGFGGASARVSINAIGETHLQKAHESLQEELDNRLENNKKDGRTPEQITIETNLNLAGHEVAIEAAPLLEFMQTKNPVEVADALGVTVEDVQKAASDGLDVIIPQGNYEGTAAKYEGFRDSTREYMSFDEGDYSVNSFKQKRALAKEAKLAADEQEKLDIQLHTIAQEMADAGVPLQQRVGMLDVISRFAMREAEGLSTKDGHKMTAAQWLEQNPLEWKNGENGGPGFLGFKQAMKRDAAQTVTDFYNKVISGTVSAGSKDKTYYDFTTGQGSVLNIAFDDLLHSYRRHNLTSTDVETIVANIDDIVDGTLDLKKKGNYGGYSALLKVSTTQGPAGVAVEFLPGGRKFVKTMFFGTDADIDNWMQKQGTAKSLSVKSDPSHSRSTPVWDIIQQQIYPGQDNSFNQRAWHGSPYSFDKFMLEHIGDGEGNQAHGYGLYFAKEKLAAQNYKDSLKNRNTAYIVNGKKIIKKPNGKYVDENGKNVEIQDQSPEAIALEFVYEGGYANRELQKLVNRWKSSLDRLKNVHGDNYLNISELAKSYKKQIDLYEKAMELLGNKKIVYDSSHQNNTSRLFEVDIPNDDVLLDEQKTYWEQPITVKNGLEKVFKNKINTNATGEELYGRLSRELGSDALASEALNAVGIRGIAYDGMIDGPCVVVFDDKAIDILNTFNQAVENGEAKGSFTPGGDGANIIRMFQGHDASTVIHETGHYFFEMFMQDSALDYASDRMKADRAAFLKYGEITEERWQYLHDGHQLSKDEFDELTKVHERVAEGFETYFIEGKPPARELRGLFRRFGSWLKSIYGIIKDGDWGNRNENAIELTDEVRAAFDHWLASEQEIEAVARIDGYFAAMPKVVTDNLSDKTKDRLAQFAEGARDKAVEIMVKKSMVNFAAERRAAIAQYKKDARPIVEAEIDEMPLYAAIAELRNVEGWKNANAKNIARKYTDSAAMVYTDYKDLKNRVDAGINDIVEPIIAQMEAGIDNSPKRTYWINKETGLEEDVSDLEATNADELKTGFTYEKVTEPDMSAPWFQHYKELYGKRISKKRIRELATEAALGHDPLGIFYEMTSNLNAEEQAQFKADMEAQAAELSSMLEIQKDMEIEGWSAKHYKDFALEPEQRVAFETIAENAGYDSGDAFARAILESPTRAQAINERIQEYVDERFPDIYKERAAAEQAAREAMYNDESAELLALEAQIVYEKALKMENNQEAAKGRAAKVAAVKAQVTLAAKAEISRMSLGEATQTKAFARAERRAAANAAKALKAGDYETAYAYKQQQMLNHAMARESMKIRQEMTKSVKFLRALRKWKPEKWGNEQHLGQAGMLMTRMGINAKGYNPAMHSQPLAAYVQEMRAAYGDDVVDIADWLMDETVDLTNPRELTIEQYRDCINALKNLRQISMQDQVMHAFAKNMEVQQWKSEAVENLNKLKDKYKADPNGKQKPTWWEQYKASMRSTDNFFEMMDGWTNGFFTKTMATPLKHCADLERKMVLAMEKRAADAYVKWLADDAARRGAEEKHMYEELGCSVDKYTLVRMLANMGNDGNARVLCTTPPLGMENGNIWVQADENISADEALAQTKENMIKFLGRVLTKADIEYAQSLIDNANYYWNDLAQVERNTKGFAPVKVEAAPVLLTMADGSSVLFKGGYFPLVQNREGGYRPKGQDTLNIDTENQSPPSAMFSTNQGSAKKRVNANYPIDMTRGCELRSMRDTIHDIAYRELMTDFRNIFNDQEMYSLMLKKLGLANMRQLKEFLTVAANPYGHGTTALGESTLAATVNWLRRKTVNAAIMLNLKTAFQNLGNITLYGNAVEGFTHQDAYNAVMKYGLQAASRTETDTDRLIAEKSVFMTERALAPDITWKDAIEAMPAEWEQKLGLNKVEKGTLKWGAKLLAYTDNLTAKPVWRYAYEMKIAEGKSDQEAVDFADAIIRRTLGSNRAQDVSSMQRGSSLFHIFTTFQGFFNTQYSQWAREYNIAARLNSEGKRKEAMERIVIFAASKWLLNCLICVWLGMENPAKKDKESDILNKWGQEWLSYPMSMLGPWGQAANMITNSLLGIRSYSYRMAAIQSTVDRYNKLARTTNNFAEGKATGKDMFENISSVALPLIGAPDQMHKLFWNGFDYFYGNISELEPADIVRRRPKSERK